MQNPNDLIQNGYLKIESAIKTNLLDELRQYADTLEQDILAHHNSGIPIKAAVETTNGLTRAYRINNVYRQRPDLISQVIASPAVLKLLSEVVGKGCVPISADIQFKHPESKHPILWHQDAIYESSTSFVNLGIYLEDSQAQDGCLRLVPGSHQEQHDILQLATDHGWDIPGAIDIATRAGDVVVHDTMTLHGSGIKYSEGCRRTLYIECCSIKTLQESGFYSKEWINLRKHWMQQVLALQTVQVWPAEWLGEYKDAEPVQDLFEVINSKFESGYCGVWAPMPVHRPGYPS